MKGGTEALRSKVNVTEQEILPRGCGTLLTDRKPLTVSYNIHV